MFRVPGLPRVRPAVGSTAYALTGAAARLTREAALAARHRLQRDRNGSAVGVVVFRSGRVVRLSRLTRIRIRLWLAWVHAWRTQWSSFDWYMTAQADRRIVSLAGIVVRNGRVAGGPARLGLVGGVFTVPEYRHSGLGSEVVRRATEFLAHELGCDYGLLQCSDDLVPFYERLGWKRVDNPAKFRRFGETRVVAGNVMVYECAGQPIPPGVIDMRGLPA